MGERRLGDPLTIEQLRAALDYDPETGILRWRYRSDCPVQWNGKWAGKLAGNYSKRPGHVRINQRHYTVHRVAWCLVYGENPPEMIDHANGDWRDNRITNLRLASRSQNAANTGVWGHNTSGFKGVCWDNRAGRWRAQIQHNKTHYYLGDFRTPEEAYDAYCNAAIRLYGEFARLR